MTDIEYDDTESMKIWTRIFSPEWSFLRQYFEREQGFL